MDTLLNIWTYSTVLQYKYASKKTNKIKTNRAGIEVMGQDMQCNNDQHQQINDISWLKLYTINKSLMFCI